MEKTMQEPAALTRAQQNMLDYFKTHDVKYVAEDGIFRNLSTGETYRGRAEIGAMLHYMYHVAFDARADFSSYIITEDKASVEGLFRGRHIGELAGIPATGKEVSIPLAVTYDLKEGLIQEARIFMLTDVLMQQLGVTAPQPKVAYLTRDIFHLKYGHYRDVKELLEEARKEGLLPEGKAQRVLTDFTGDAYRLILEEGFDSLAEFERELTGELMKDGWQQWYKRFREHVESGHREILKQIM
jgi:predicted ester cyclase